VAAGKQRHDLIGLADGPFAEDDGFCLMSAHRGAEPD
jgi:hypothetical protein